jgi:predicted esterase
MRYAIFTVVLLVASAGVRAEESAWSGEWVTDLGLLSLEVNGTKAEGTYGGDGSLEGKVDGRSLTLTWERGRGSGNGSFALDEKGAFFKGSWTSRGGGGTWRGWKKDPGAAKADTADFAGTWLTSFGTMVVTQNGSKVTGEYGSQGWSSMKGTVKGRRIVLTKKRIRWSEKAWIEMTPDGKRFFGMTEGQKPTKWLGVRLEGFTPDVKPKAGKIVKGLSLNKMCYFLRAPKGWRKSKSTDAIILLHGSNWTTAGMTAVTATRWPEIGKKFMVIGIQGENWADWSDPDDLRFNYTYINWCGRSTLKGYPYTDRESPFLVHQVVADLAEKHNLDRIFVVGHSQGGFLAYYLYMHFPETFAGVAPLSCGLTIQCEPDVFDDDDLLAAQRATPLALVHGTLDAQWGPKSGDYNYDRFAAHSFPMLTYLKPNASHAYDFLPIGETIAWLDVMSTNDARKLAEAWHDVAGALARAEKIGARAKLAAVVAKLDAASGKDADRLLEAIKKNKDATWVDDFLAWRDEFEFAPAAKPVMAAYAKLQKKHDKPAEDLINEARKAFRSGDQAAGWEAYQEILEKYPACRRYRVVKRWLANRR